MGVVVRRYIDILTIIINFPYSTCISSFFSSSIPTSLFIFKMFFGLYSIQLAGLRVNTYFPLLVITYLPQNGRAYSNILRGNPVLSIYSCYPFLMPFG